MDVSPVLDTFGDKVITYVKRADFGDDMEAYRKALDDANALYLWVLADLDKETLDLVEATGKGCCAVYPRYDLKEYILKAVADSARQELSEKWDAAFKAADPETLELRLSVEREVLAWGESLETVLLRRFATATWQVRFYGEPEKGSAVQRAVDAWNREHNRVKGTCARGGAASSEHERQLRDVAIAAIKQDLANETGDVLRARTQELVTKLANNLKDTLAAWVAQQPVTRSQVTALADDAARIISPTANRLMHEAANSMSVDVDRVARQKEISSVDASRMSSARRVEYYAQNIRTELGRATTEEKEQAIALACQVLGLSKPGIFSKIKAFIFGSNPTNNKTDK